MSDFDEDRAREIPWFGRVEVVYKQPREDEKQSELFFYRGYSRDALHVFDARLNLGIANRSHNRGSIIQIPYAEIDDVVIWSRRERIDMDTGDAMPNAKSRYGVGVTRVEGSGGNVLEIDVLDNGDISVGVTNTEGQTTYADFPNPINGGGDEKAYVDLLAARGIIEERRRG